MLVNSNSNDDDNKSNRTQNLSFWSPALGSAET